jgi:hypothetical protein
VLAGVFVGYDAGEGVEVLGGSVRGYKEGREGKWKRG